MIISDRDKKFTSPFSKRLWAEIGRQLAMTTAYHPQSDGLYDPFGQLGRHLSGRSHKDREAAFLQAEKLDSPSVMVTSINEAADNWDCSGCSEKVRLLAKSREHFHNLPEPNSMALFV
ncbi:hypothetical protein FPOAC1_004454 [Fusarium poae]|uniref:hypothetical protein n=1 Tax=Fusarium poae TaxID=36050 RepID=UPI001CE795DE|nr:hypothetical protein FPOAC1_004454 [Fusarium poae]KAG8671213.1 hypothetical protein FPOAC1_004454 [Fusarium poae]